MELLLQEQDEPLSRRNSDRGPATSYVFGFGFGVGFRGLRNAIQKAVFDASFFHRKAEATIGFAIFKALGESADEGSNELACVTAEGPRGEIPRKAA